MNKYTIGQKFYHYHGNRLCIVFNIRHGYIESKEVDTDIHNTVFHPTSTVGINSKIAYDVLFDKELDQLLNA